MRYDFLKRFTQRPVLLIVLAIGLISSLNHHLLFISDTDTCATSPYSDFKHVYCLKDGDVESYVRDISLEPAAILTPIIFKVFHPYEAVEGGLYSGLRNGYAEHAALFALYDPWVGVHYQVYQSSVIRVLVFNILLLLVNIPYWFIVAYGTTLLWSGRKWLKFLVLLFFFNKIFLFSNIFGLFLLDILLRVFRFF